ICYYRSPEAVIIVVPSSILVAKLGLDPGPTTDPSLHTLVITPKSLAYVAEEKDKNSECSIAAKSTCSENAAGRSKLWRKNLAARLKNHNLRSIQPSTSLAMPRGREDPVSDSVVKEPMTAAAVAVPAEQTISPYDGLLDSNLSIQTIIRDPRLAKRFKPNIEFGTMTLVPVSAPSPGPASAVMQDVTPVIALGSTADRTQSPTQDSSMILSSTSTSSLSFIVAVNKPELPKMNANIKQESEDLLSEINSTVSIVELEPELKPKTLLESADKSDGYMLIRLTLCEDDLQYTENDLQDDEEAFCCFGYGSNPVPLSTTQRSSFIEVTFYIVEIWSMHSLSLIIEDRYYLHLSVGMRISFDRLSLEGSSVVALLQSCFLRL
ncbi:unnamed protein product, partial [Soboliphyme baturini]|uniref:Flocculation protein FLO11-like n=1 Tax=Soboliphyme baturini TaxID=241478 RepID=A0A183J646_9BILA